jgi:hypothetical protein
MLRRSGSSALCCVQRCNGKALRPRPSAALLWRSMSSCCLPASTPGPTRVAAAMAARPRAATALRCELLGEAPGRAGRRSCHCARGARTPGRCTPGSAPLGQRLRKRRETPCAPWGARSNARGRGRMAGDRRCSRGVRPSAGAGRSVDAGAGRRRARRGSADVPAPDPRGAQAPAARGAEACQAAGLVPPPRDGSITAARGRRTRTGSLRNHTPPR